MGTCVSAPPKHASTQSPGKLCNKSNGSQPSQHMGHIPQHNGQYQGQQINNQPASQAVHYGKENETSTYQNLHHSLSGVQKISYAVPREQLNVKLSQPDNNSSEAWTDDQFSIEKAMQDIKKNGITWKRPKEFASKICLFEDGACKFDVGQGSVGTCWFLCMMAAISDKGHILQQIFPEGENSYNQARGIFHCRLWDFGQWVDIYCDDFLPVKNGKPWGARSATFTGEMWVPFLEKALAKYCGSYIEISGGLISRAFRCLTGGITEQITQNEIADYLEFFNRARNALASGAIIGAVCEKAVYGLIDKHAYTLTGAVRIVYQGKPLELLRLRNPWGHTVDGKGEWTGPWSDKAPHWQYVDEHTRGYLQRDEDDGEFWMSLADFLHTYSTSIICNVTPDFDRDGTCDGLDYVCSLYGEWRGPSAAGHKNSLDNPMFVIVVPPGGDGSVIPLVTELMQFREIMGGEKHSIKCYVYKLRGERPSYRRGKAVTLEEKNFLSAWEKIDRLLVEAGQYLLVPSTFEPGREGEFLLRVFSERPLLFAGQVHRSELM